MTDVQCFEADPLNCLTLGRQTKALPYFSINMEKVSNLTRTHSPFFLRHRKTPSNLPSRHSEQSFAYQCDNWELSRNLLLVFNF